MTWYGVVVYVRTHSVEIEGEGWIGKKGSYFSYSSSLQEVSINCNLRPPRKWAVELLQLLNMLQIVKCNEFSYMSGIDTLIVPEAVSLIVYCACSPLLLLRMGKHCACQYVAFISKYL